MANSFVLVDKFLPIIDEVYKVESKTSALDTANSEIQFINANTVKIMKKTMDGLGDYSRANGFPSGDITTIWETKTLEMDRAKSFVIDSMDDEESFSLIASSTLGQFVREKVVPEVDSYRFAKYATAAGTSVKGAATGMAAAIDTAEAVMNDAEIPEEGRILYISEAAYKDLKGSITRTFGNDNVIRHQVGTYDGMPVVRVPSSRFNTAIQTTANGYTQNGDAINFLIVHPSATRQLVKHVKPRVFTPDQFQTADAWKVDYRLYHTAFTLDNKTMGIYCHHA